jgi:hypothetical protein
MARGVLQNKTSKSVDTIGGHTNLDWYVRESSPRIWTCNLAK